MEQSQGAVAVVQGQTFNDYLLTYVLRLNSCKNWKYKVDVDPWQHYLDIST